MVSKFRNGIKNIKIIVAGNEEEVAKLNGHGPGKNKCSLLKYEDPEKIQCGPEEKMKTDISLRSK